jgi:hypothetical protein
MWSSLPATKFEIRHEISDNSTSEGRMLVGQAHNSDIDFRDKVHVGNQMLLRGGSESDMYV